VTLLMDVAMLVSENLVKRAAVICPDNLMKNWIEDLHKSSVAAGSWNIIPINLRTYKFWARERFAEMIQHAPKNTMFVIGYNFFKAEGYSVVIGNHVERTSAGLEFLRMFEFDYIALDESHRIKSEFSARHKLVKQVCTCSAVKYIRLASGSLISNRVNDIVGQSAMLSPQIFRTVAEYKAENN